MKKYVAMLLVMLLLFASTANAQLNLTYTSFQPGQTISSAQFTANFTAISSNALNRTGGTMTGTLTTQAVVPSTTNTYDFGTDATRFRDGYISRDLFVGDDLGVDGELTVAGAASFASVSVSGLTCTGCIGASQLASSGVTASSYGNATTSVVGALTVDEDGRLTSASTMSVSSFNIQESQIIDSTALARVADDETISGTWTFTENFSISKALPYIRITESDQVANEQNWLVLAEGKVFQIRAYNSDLSSSTAAINIARGSGTAISSITLAAPVTVDSTLGATGVISANAGLNATTIATSSTLSVGTDLTVGDDATITGDLTVTGSFVAGSLQFADGTLGSPSISFANDTNTGIYVVPDTSIEFGLNGTQMISIQSGVTFFTQSINTRAIVPNASATYNIGTSSNLYNIVYALDFLSTSDRRAKMDIAPLELGIEFIDAVKPVQYRFVKSPARVRYGFIAQDLQKLGFAGVDTSDPNNFVLSYDEMIAPMVKGLQDVHSELHQLQGVVKLQQAEIEFLVKRIKVLEKGYGGRVAE
jgi:hypothetical protein